MNERTICDDFVVDAKNPYYKSQRKGYELY